MLSIQVHKEKKGTVPEGIADPYGPWGGIAKGWEAWWGIHDGAGLPMLEVGGMPAGGAKFGKAPCKGAIEGNYKNKV